ncbi:MAG: type II toxin-antitoxin system VapB family antitoxin [Planctomycetota bacterium]
MRTTLDIEGSLLDRAAFLTGIRDEAALVRKGLETLIALESTRRLAALGGTQPDLEVTPRRRD